MLSCPHCGEPVTEAQGHCPSCGSALGDAWPPAPKLGTPLPPARPRTLTGRVWADFLLGALVQYLAHLATARALIQTIPVPNPANAYDFVGITQDWNRVFAILSVTLQEAAELVVFGALAYFFVRRFYLVIARGSGYATLALLVVELGALFTCRPVNY